MTKPTQETDEDFSLTVAAPTRVCVTWSYDTTDSPTLFTYLDRAWTLTLPAPRAAGKPTTLATFHGSGSKLLRVPAGAQVDGAKVCWNMPGSGNHILQLEQDTAGDGLNILTNALGSSDADCASGTAVTPYIQVIDEGSWSITITNY